MCTQQRRLSLAIANLCVHGELDLLLLAQGVRDVHQQARVRLQVDRLRALLTEGEGGHISSSQNINSCSIYIYVIYMYTQRESVAPCGPNQRHSTPMRG